MDENLVGYLLDGLDDRTRRQVEAHLAADPAARARLALLRQALAPLDADREPAAPPRDLFVRTLTVVAEHICHPPETIPLPKAPPIPADAPVPTRGWWRRADVLIAAGLLITALGVLLPALLHLRSAGAVTLCQNNLRQFYAALEVYRDGHGSFPNVAAEAPRNVAGMVVPLLADAGVLPAAASIRCPGNGPHLGCDLTLASLRAMSPDEFQTTAPRLSHCYAYSLGYRDAAGYHPPGSAGSQPGSLTPLMADRPPSAGARENSVNHYGAGQNVLFLDGHVRFLPTRTVRDDDLFLNVHNEVAAGVGPADNVLGYSAAQP